MTRGAGAPIARNGGGRESILPFVATRAFLLMCIIFVTLGFASGGLVANLVSMMIDRGLKPSEAATVASFARISVILGRGGIGFLLDRWDAARLLACVAVFSVGATLLLAWVPGRPAGYAASLLLGIVLGAEVDSTAYLIRRYFGEAVFARLYGLAFGIFSLGVAAGPLLLSLSYDHFHNYHSGLLLLAGLGILATALTFALPPYNRLPSAQYGNRRHSSTQTSTT